MLIFTDASFSSSTNVSGFGFAIIDKKFNYNAGNYSFRCKDNNVAEVGAIAEALRFGKQMNIFNLTNDRTLTIISDSKVALQRILTRTPTTEAEEQFINEIYNNLSKIKKLKVTFIQIKGHTKGTDKFSYYNDIADCIAKDYRYLGEIELTRKLTKTKGNIKE